MLKLTIEEDFLVLGKPQNKCPHGIFKAGEPTARYCSFCNPNLSAAARPAGRTIPEVMEEREDVLDVFQFINQRAGRRLGC
jgi:hypothetical protein